METNKRKSERNRTLAEFYERNQEGRDVFHSVLQGGTIINTRMIHWIWQLRERIRQKLERNWDGEKGKEKTLNQIRSSRCPSKTDISWSHFYLQPRIVKLREAESKIMVAIIGILGGKGDVGRYWSKSTEFQLYKISKFWSSNVQQCGYS